MGMPGEKRANETVKNKFPKFARGWVAYRADAEAGQNFKQENEGQENNNFIFLSFIFLFICG